MGLRGKNNVSECLCFFLKAWEDNPLSHLSTFQRPFILFRVFSHVYNPAVFLTLFPFFQIFSYQSLGEFSTFKDSWWLDWTHLNNPGNLHYGMGKYKPSLLNWVTYSKICFQCNISIDSGNSQWISWRSIILSTTQNY